MGVTIGESAIIGANSFVSRTKLYNMGRKDSVQSTGSDRSVVRRADSHHREGQSDSTDNILAGDSDALREHQSEPRQMGPLRALEQWPAQQIGRTIVQPRRDPRSEVLLSLQSHRFWTSFRQTPAEDQATVCQCYAIAGREQAPIGSLGISHSSA
jgi:hypothetical protein